MTYFYELYFIIVATVNRFRITVKLCADIYLWMNLKI